MADHETNQPWHVGVFYTGHNADTMDAPADIDIGGDADGHVVGGAVLRFQASETPMAPVKVRVSHGCSPATAAAMLRKIATLIEGKPEILSEEPGWQVRRGPDGEVSKKKLTIEGIRAVADALPADLRAQLDEMLGRIGPAIGDEGSEDQDGLGPGDQGMTPRY